MSLTWTFPTHLKLSSSYLTGTCWNRHDEMAARYRNWTPEIVRQRIRTSMLLRRLTDHVLGKVEMAPSQVTAGLGLLKKTLPDLASVEHSGGLQITEATELSDAELTDIASGRSSRATIQKSSKEEFPEFH
jgi:hypothetical protein